MAPNGNLFGVGFNTVSKTCPFVLPAHLLNGNTALYHCSTMGTIGNGVYVVCSGVGQLGKLFTSWRAAWVMYTAADRRRLGSGGSRHRPFTCVRANLEKARHTLFSSHSSLMKFPGGLHAPSEQDFIRKEGKKWGIQHCLCPKTEPLCTHKISN